MPVWQKVLEGNSLMIKMYTLLVLLLSTARFFNKQDSKGLSYPDLYLVKHKAQLGPHKEMRIEKYPKIFPHWAVQE